MGAYGKGWKEGYKRTQILRHEGYIFYLDHGDGFRGVYIRRNLSNHILHKYVN